MYKATLFYKTVLIFGLQCLVVADNSTSEAVTQNSTSRTVIQKSTSKAPKMYQRHIDQNIIEYRDMEYNAIRIIDLQAQPHYKIITVDTNQYFLYTRRNPRIPQVLFDNNAPLILSSSFNPADQTIFIIHDWKGDWKSQLNIAIRDAFLSVIIANIIVVDWSAISSTDYATASATASRVGRPLGQFLKFLHFKVGTSYSTMHLVGYGLGAHVAGNAGNFLQPSGRMARITGLDPAGPLWTKHAKRLKARDADYVEAIHTDSKLLGSNTRFGHVDFYPNGGFSQPGCRNNHSSCSHMRSWQLFAATVMYNHLTGRRCLSTAALGLNMCYNEYLPMGNDDLLKRGKGLYRVTTGPEYPYMQIF